VGRAPVKRRDESMIRNLRILALVGMAMAAFAAYSAPGAQAAEFHCSVEPCRYTVKPDGAPGTTHQVFWVRNSGGEAVVFTCQQLTGVATTAGKTASELTVSSLGFGLPCYVNGTPGAAISLNGCHFTYGASGTFSIKGCLGGGGFELTLAGCALKVPEQGPINGVKFHNVGEEPKTTTEITGEVSGMTLAGSVTQQCGMDLTKTPITVEYKTGNFLVTSETDPGGVMANAWWA
jgi:hypothetical protein